MKRIIVKMNLLNRLKNAEHYDLMEAIITRVKELVLMFTVLTEPWNKLEGRFRSEDEIYKQILGQAETQLVEEAGDKRSKSTRRIRKAIDAFRHSQVTEEHEAYMKLSALAHLYRNATYMPYREDSALITNFLQDLTSEHYKDYSELLNLMPLIDEAREDNEAFKEIYRGRVETSFESSDASLSAARLDTDRALQSVSTSIDSLYNITHLENPASAELQKLGGIIDIINSELQDIERIYARRVPNYKITKKPDDGTDDTDDTDYSTYEMEVEKQIYGGQFQTVIDSDPEAFAKRFGDTPLDENAILYEEYNGEKSDTSLYFSDYYYIEGKLVGITFYTDREVVLRRDGEIPGIKGSDYTYTLERGGKVLIRLSTFIMPEFVL